MDAALTCACSAVMKPAAFEGHTASRADAPRWRLGRAGSRQEPGVILGNLKCSCATGSSHGSSPALAHEQCSHLPFPPRPALRVTPERKEAGRALVWHVHHKAARVHNKAAAPVKDAPEQGRLQVGGKEV